MPGRLGYLNDLWAYNTYVNVWTWLGGSSGVNSPGGIVGSTGFPASIPSRANPLLFSGNDGYEAELTLIGGVALESKVARTTFFFLSFFLFSTVF